MRRILHYLDKSEFYFYIVVYLTVIFFTTQLIAFDYRKESELLESQIQKVTVYPNSAKITRSAEKMLESGTQWLRVGPIPPDILADETKAELNDSFRGKILQLNMGSRFENKSLSEENLTLIAELKELFQELRSQRNQANLIQKELQFIDALSFDSTTRQENEHFAENIAEISEIVRSIKTLRNATKLTEKETAETIEDLNFRFQRHLNQIQELMGSAKKEVWNNYVYLRIQSDIRQKIELNVSYQVRPANWEPHYNARLTLDREKGIAKMDLALSGKIAQTSSEDWLQATLNLENREPVPLSLPKLTRWVLKENRIPYQNASFGSGLRRAKQSARMAQTEVYEDEADYGMAASDMITPELIAKAPSPVPASAPKRARSRDKGFKEKKAHRGVTSSYLLSESRKVDIIGLNQKSFTESYPVLASLGFNQISQPMGIQFGSIQKARSFYQPKRLPTTFQYTPNSSSESQFVNYPIVRKADIKNSGIAMELPINSFQLQGPLQYIAIPKRDKRVFIQANFHYQDDLPLLTGASNVFINGQFIKNGVIQNLRKGNHFLMDLGIDRNITVNRKVTKKSEKSGLISTTQNTLYDVEIEIVNQHPFAIEMQLEDQLPISNMDAIDVHFKGSNPKARTDKSKRLFWTKKMQPKEKWEVSFQYKLEHPDDFIIRKFETD